MENVALSAVIPAAVRGVVAGRWSAAAATRIAVAVAVGLTAGGGAAPVARGGLLPLFALRPTTVPLSACSQRFASAISSDARACCAQRVFLYSL